MPNVQEGYKRITGQIPIAMHDKISLYNKVSSRPINVSKAIEACLAKEMETIDAYSLEVAECIKEHNWCSEEDYNYVLADIKAGKEPSEIYSNFIKRKKDKDEDFKHGLDNPMSFVPLFPIDQVKAVESLERIEFYAKGVFCFCVCVEGYFPGSTRELYQ